MPSNVSTTGPGSPGAVRQFEAYPSHPEADSFDFRTTWLAVRQACRGHKVLILMTGALTVLLMIVYIVVWPPVYASSVTLVAESDRDPGREEFYQTWNIFRKDRLADEVHLVSTSPILVGVIDKLHLTDADVHHTFFAYTTKLWINSWPGRAYRATKGFVFGRKTGPYILTPEQIDRAQTVSNFRSGVSLAAEGESNIGRLTVLGPSPRVAEMANTLADVYLEQRRIRYEQEADDAYRALEQESSKAERELLTLEQKMKQYYANNGLMMMFEKDKLDMNQWAALRGSIGDHQSSIANDMASLAQVSAQLAQEPREISTGRLMRSSAPRDALTERLSQLDLSRKQLLIHYRADSPEVLELNRQISVVREQLASEPAEIEQQRQVVVNDAYQGLNLRKRQIETDMAGHRAALAVQQGQAARYGAALAALPEKLQVTHDFDREHSSLEKRYVVLQEKMQIAQVSRAAAASAPQSIRIVEGASIPENAQWPKVKLLLPAAAALGLAVGVVLALLSDLMSGRVSRFRFASDFDHFGSYAVLVHDGPAARRLFALAAPAFDHGEARR